MTLALSSIVVDGAAVELGDVLADVTIRHGRAGYFDAASPSTCDLTLLGVSSELSRRFPLGGTLVVNATGEPVSNYFPNGGFETADFSNYWGTMVPAQDSAQKRSGGFSGRFAPPAPQYIGAFVNGAAMAVHGSRIRLRAWVKGSAAGQSMALFVNGYQPADYNVCGVTKPLTTEWQLFEAVGYTAAAGELAAGGYLYGASEVTVPFWIDDVTVEWLDEPSPRFTGRFTDAELVGDSLTAIAVGRLRTLSGYPIGPGTYPEETWSQRVTRVFTDAGLGAQLVLEVGAFDPVLVAETLETNVAAYLDTLVDPFAAVADLPDGRILVQAIGSRSLSLVELDPAEVEYAPAWSMRLPGANIVTVRYGEPEAALTVTDATSVGLYGPISVGLDTSIKSTVDADELARLRLARDAYAHWNVLELALLVGRRFSIGTAFELEQLPASAPFDPWTPILEGWTDRIFSDGETLEWTMLLAVSDPLLSGLTLPWQSVPAELLWNTIDPATPWRDALTLDDLEL